MKHIIPRILFTVSRLGIPLTVRRFIEIIFVEIALSTVTALLSYAGLYKSYQSAFLSCLIITVAYFAWTVYCLMSFRLAVYGKKQYFLVNLPIYALLFAAAIICGKLDIEPVYSFLFAPFKFFHYAAKCWAFPGSGRMSRSVSAALVSAGFAIPLVIIPFIISTKHKLKIRGIYVKKKPKPIKDEIQNKDNET